MATVKLTKSRVDAAEPRTRRYTIFDAELKGFGLRVSPSGQRSWIVEYRANGGGRNAAKRRVTLGSVGTLTPDEARKAARDILAKAQLGTDPASDRAKARRTSTIAELASLFSSEHLEAKRKPRTAEHYRDVLERIVLPALGKLRVDTVSRQDIARLHLAWKHTPVQANRMLAIVGSLYGFAVQRGLVAEDTNPARRVEKFKEQRRERFLSEDELARLGAAIQEAETIGLPWHVDAESTNAKHLPKNAESRRTRLSPHAAAALRLLILTGARLREILHLRWEEVDFGRGLLLLPDSKTGRKAIILNAPALTLLEALPRLGSFVIAGDDPERPRADLKKPWRAVSRRAGLDGVRLHDLRHTFASYGAGNGLGLPIIGKLLGHSQSSTTQRYAHLDNDPLRKASNAIGERIAEALGQIAADANMVPPSRSKDR